MIKRFKTKLLKKVFKLQEQLGKLMGVKKSQISRLENSTRNVTSATVMRIFNTLGAKLLTSHRYNITF